MLLRVSVQFPGGDEVRQLDRAPALVPPAHLEFTVLDP
jgi:hypothetical protein